ncbi:aldehyde dehydrogenase family protein [Oceanicola sp. D3]|uniref:aldehyde dehydrogenase family protein n=1 Tax=Oceanicola sp. D3 TaxID=2587163 RepID=UPI0011240F92|nr:aldehyde dehydrogenase family protein [Oceanicola sp. D3]QDC10077.1 aldehyde dehydrogenase family protein [Oceanicola sp. D3]
MTDYPMIIGGQKRMAASSFDVTDPATGDVAGQAPKGTLADLEDAVAAAKAAFPAYSALSDETRRDYCTQIAAAIEAETEALAELITRETGKPLQGLGSRFEVGGACGWAGYAASLSMAPEMIQDDNEGRVSMHRKPVGVVGSITPWNWPMLIAIWHIIPAVRSGNTIVVKPSPMAPLSTLRLIEIINGILPAGVVNVVTGPDEIGAAMSAHPDIAKMVFTGSSATGVKVMRSAADTLKKLTLELGGNDAGIVLPDVDPAEIAEGLFWGAFINTGQTCGALKRLYVHDDVYDAVCEALTKLVAAMPMGSGLDENHVLGPLQNRMQFDKVVALVEDAKAKGGRVLTGGAPSTGPGNFYPITLVADLDNGVPLVDEEQFGPALPIIRYSDVDEVIARANDNPNGLGGSIWTRDLEQGRALALRLECGSVWINAHGAIRPDVPFGGTKQSGLGVEFGQAGLDEYCDRQVVFG